MASQSASSSSITSQHQEEMNKKESEEKIVNPNSNNIDFVKLSIDNSVHGKRVMQEYDFFGPIQVGSSSRFPNNNNEGKDENNDEKNNSDPKYYSCVYCKGQYSSLQALGGHQNAHKQERALQKVQIKPSYDGSASGLGNSGFNPYLNYCSAFSPYYNPLGVRMESMIQKPPYISPRFGHGGFCYQNMLHPSLVSLRDNIQGSGFASLGLGGATTSRIEDEVGRNRRFDDAMLKLAESSANMMASASTMAGIHNNTKSNIEEDEDEDSSGLDLTLKL